MTSEQLDRLARALFEEQERMLPEGIPWEDQTTGDVAYWRNSAAAVMREWEKIKNEQGATER